MRRRQPMRGTRTRLRMIADDRGRRRRQRLASGIPAQPHLGRRHARGSRGPREPEPMSTEHGDAVPEAAHPACEYNLRTMENAGAGDVREMRASRVNALCIALSRAVGSSLQLSPTPKSARHRRRAHAALRRSPPPALRMRHDGLRAPRPSLLPRGASGSHPRSDADVGAWIVP